MQAAELQRKLKPRSKRARRILEKREPKLVEDIKKALLLHGGNVSQVTKDVLSDFRKLKGVDAQLFTRRNADVRPFEPGGEASLEFFADKADCGVFCLASHSKKRPHNLTLGRFFDRRLLDLLELGVEKFRPLKAFGAAGTAVQAGNKPCFVFVGEQFDNVPEFKLAKSLLLDMFRGRLVDGINLKGITNVMFVTALDRVLLLRQYAVAMKKSGTKIPRVELREMGPALDLALRRYRAAAPDLEKEALKLPKLGKKKEKNVSADLLDGKVGRIYMPKQDVGGIALHKMKGLKRKRQAAAADGRAASADTRAVSADARSEALVPDGRTKPRKKSKLAAAVAAAVE
ncbi:hypothetical protein WJX81_002634 [Elliptochloris bilobata]|uniref:Ribosome production factor 2 homolog n=1 Tax=Elliptochloris bilobata TaxID=381761 RepID=A0AAW1QUU3_9CHLO